MHHYSDSLIERFSQYATSSAIRYKTPDPFQDRFQLAYFKLLQAYNKNKERGVDISIEDSAYWYKVARNGILWDIAGRNTRGKNNPGKREKFMQWSKAIESVIEKELQRRVNSYFNKDITKEVISNDLLKVVKFTGKKHVKEIINLIASGKTIKETASILNLRISSLKTYISLIKTNFNKFYAKSDKIERKD